MAEKQREEREFSNEEVLWMNKTESGKGVRIFVGEDLYVASLTALKKVADGEKSAVKFSKMVAKK